MSLDPYLKSVLKLPALEAAPRLLGCTIERQTKEGLLSLKIVEVEAYHQDDAASHSYRGITKRTSPMFDAGGVIYVYFTYGMHYCINFVTGKKGVGEAVLLRAGQPISGIDIMRRMRNQESIYQLANGPGKLAQALGIVNTELSGLPISKNTINLLPPNDNDLNQIISAPRVGISKARDLPWRFYLKDNKFVSHL